MKRKFIKGAFVLTLAGLVTRIIGFFYKIFLAKSMGSELMGIYQLVFPVFSICYTLFASGIQTAVSKQIAEYNGFEARQKHLIRFATATSLFLAVALMVIVSNNSGFIANSLIGEPQAASGIRILSYCFPFCAITSCINGYFYGLKKSGIPATSQLLEQIARVGLVCCVTYLTTSDLTVSCELAVGGVVAGEIVSCLFNISSLLKENESKQHKSKGSGELPSFDLKGLYGLFSKMYIPLTINRFVLTLLHSYETILIPKLLMRYGYSHSSAVSTLGILNGMTIPFLVFPSAITSAISILLLPTISEANAGGDKAACKRLTNKVLTYSLVLGFYCLGIFTILGRELCQLLFENSEAGNYLYILAFICPLMYMSASIPSIINGIGKPMITFRNSCIISSLQIVMLAVTVTIFGLTGYFITMFFMQVVQAFIDLYSLNKEELISLNAFECVLKPGLSLVILIPAGGIFLTLLQGSFSMTGSIGICAAAFTVIYGITELLLGVVSLKDF